MAARQQPGAPVNYQIDEGLDTLWRFQLRKENAALLEKIEENARAIESCRVDNMKCFQDFNERITFIEATIARIENTEKEASKALELQLQDVAILKKKLENFEDGIPRAKVDAAQTCRSAVIPSPISLPESTVHRPVSERTRAHVRSCDPAKNGHLLSMPDDMTKESMGLAGCSSTVRRTTAVRAPASKSNIATRITTSTKRPAINNSKQQNISTAEVLLMQTPSSSNKILDPPLLVQGESSSVGAYHASASKVFANLKLDKTGEIEFIACFLNGIRTADNRGLLIKQLEKTSPSFTESGKQRILCEWSDVTEALRSSGLVELEKAAGAPPAKRKRRILIPPEMIKDGMMKPSADTEM